MPVDMFPPHKAATHPLGAAPTQPDQCSDHPQQNQPEPPPRPGALATPSACRCRGSCGAELAGGVPIWQVLGRDDPSPCLLTSQISSYPVALAFPGESWFEAAPRLSQLRASFGTHLTWRGFGHVVGEDRAPSSEGLVRGALGIFLSLFLSPLPQAAGTCCATMKVTVWFHSPVGNKPVSARLLVENHPWQLAAARVCPQAPS